MQAKCIPAVFEVLNTNLNLMKSTISVYTIFTCQIIDKQLVKSPKKSVAAALGKMGVKLKFRRTLEIQQKPVTE